MILLLDAVLFVGYLLVYAATANGGRFATTPWEALRQDAYAAGGSSPSSSSSPAGGGHPSTFDQIVGGWSWLIRHLPGPWGPAR